MEYSDIAWQIFTKSQSLVNFTRKWIAKQIWRGRRRPSSLNSKLWKLILQFLVRLISGIGKQTFQLFMAVLALFDFIAAEHPAKYCRWWPKLYPENTRRRRRRWQWRRPWQSPSAKGNISARFPFFNFDIIIMKMGYQGSRFKVHLLHTIYIKLTWKEKYGYNTWLQDKIITIQVKKCVWWSK